MNPYAQLALYLSSIPQIAFTILLIISRDQQNNRRQLFYLTLLTLGLALYPLTWLFFLTTSGHVSQISERLITTAGAIICLSGAHFFEITGWQGKRVLPRNFNKYGVAIILLSLYPGAGIDNQYLFISGVSIHEIIYGFYLLYLCIGLFAIIAQFLNHKKTTRLYRGLFQAFVFFCFSAFSADVIPYTFYEYQKLSYLGPTSSLIFSAALYWACLKLNFFSLKDSLIKISLIMLGLIILTGFFMPISNMNSIRILLIGLCVFLIRDIWRKDSALQDDFLQTKQKLETATEEKEALADYVKDMAHKLKSPFNMIENLIVEVMSITKKGAAQLFRAFDIAHSTRSQMNNLIMAGGIDSQQTNLDRQPADVTSLIKDSLPEWHALCPNHKLTLTDALGPTNLIIDRNALKDALTNLIDNARKYSPAGSHISIGLKKDRRSVLISVTDEGRGIPFEARNKIFDRNYQIKDTEMGQIGSAGLGLSLVRWIAEQHGGEVRVQSRIGKGSTFTISLPIQVTADHPEENLRKRVVKQTLRP